MENNRYRNINELLNEIESLGDWRDVSQRDKFLKVLSKITVIYNGYELKDESGKKFKERYPDEVMQAIVKACKGKFPTKEQAFDKDGHLKPEYPNYIEYLALVNDALGIRVMGEASRIDEIAKNKFGIDVYHTPATQEGVDELVNSSKKYYYEKVLGMTEEEHKQEMNKMRKECEEKGKAFIYPERMKKWEKCVKAIAGDLYYGKDLDLALALMEKLESGASMEEVKEMFNEQEHSGPYEGIARSILLHFAKRGPEFYESTARTELPDKEKEAVKDKKKENKLLESLHASNDIKSNLLGAMSMTRSRLRFEDLKIFLPEEQYEEVLSTVQEKWKKHLAELGYKNITQEQMKKNIAMDRFEIFVDDNGSFILQEYTINVEKLTRPINVSEIDESKLASVVEKAMQKHLDYGKFDTNRYLTAEQIPQTLEYYINIARDFKRKSEETEIGNLSSEKSKLESKIGDIDNQLKELGEKAVGLEKPLEEK